MSYHERIRRLLEDIVNPENVADDEATLAVYSEDTTPEHPHMPEYVVRPGDVAEVQKIVRLANREKIPLVPFIAGTNVGGLTIPEEGGIIVDLKRMDEIIEINEDDMYAILEPGVNFGKFSSELAKRGMWYPYPVANVSASVLTNALLMGIGHLTTRFADQSRHITGLEVVLPTGEIVKVGSCSISSIWFSRAPTPDLAGLFIGWQGTTGIVTKIGLSIYLQPPYIQPISYGADTDENMRDFMVNVGKTYVADDITSIHWDLSQIPVKKSPLPPKPEGEPEWITFCIVTSWNEKELDGKKQTIQRIAEEEKDKGSSLREYPLPEEILARRVTVPTNVGLTYIDTRAGGGIAWPGTYTPASKWPAVLKKWKALYREYGFAFGARTSLNAGAHHGMCRCMTPFNKGDPEEVRKVRELLKKCVNVAVEEGGLPYKPTSGWARDILLPNANPGFVELLNRVKRMLDPNRIMNPGKLGL